MIGLALQGKILDARTALSLMVCHLLSLLMRPSLLALFYSNEVTTNDPESPSKMVENVTKWNAVFRTLKTK
jgi:hypothetical protein